LQFRIQATAQTSAYPCLSNVTTRVGRRLTLAGSTTRSLLSGTVNIHDIAMHSHSDIGSILSSAAAPPTSPSVSTGVLAGMRSMLKIQTAADVQFRTTPRRTCQADANLTLRGTIDHPGMLGRPSPSPRARSFFSARNTPSIGTVSFFNPNKIEPHFSTSDLETTVQGVDVSLSVSGPVKK